MHQTYQEKELETFRCVVNNVEFDYQSEMVEADYPEFAAAKFIEELTKEYDFKKKLDVTAFVTVYCPDGTSQNFFVKPHATVIFMAKFLE